MTAPSRGVGQEQARDAGPRRALGGKGRARGCEPTRPGRLHPMRGFCLPAAHGPQVPKSQGTRESGLSPEVQNRPGAVGTWSGRKQSVSCSSALLGSE